jgi:hypothetical protein
MDEKIFSFFSGTIFAMLAVADFEEWSIAIADWSVPKTVAWGAVVVACGLALIGLRLSQR